MTQKEKLQKAHLMACSIKSIANRLRQSARSFDVQFPIAEADNLDRLANDYLKLK